MCKTPQEVGEIDTHNFQENLLAKTLFETKIKKNYNVKIINDKNISNVVDQKNISNDIELPIEIIEAKPEKGFKTELIKFKNGDTFQGYYNEKNKREGYGIYIKKNGYIFKGLWKDDKIGDYGLLIEPNGNYYKGNLIDGEANGEGEMYINNEFKYIGYFENNLPNKKGKIINFIDNFIYEGDIVNGKQEGKGILKFNDGTIYEGDFIDNKYEGNGKLTFKNGNIYEGNFHNNTINGKGKYIYADGKEYNGDFLMGLKHGFGKLSWSNDKYFEGFWINNRQHGEGMFYHEGKILKGIFRYGKMIMKID